MATSVLIPWRPGDAHREAALSLVTERLSGFDVILGRHDDGPWCKAAAVADALRQTDADTLVIHDADVWSDGLPTAIENLDAWSIPHGTVYRLARGQIEPTLDRSQIDGHPYQGYEGGGIVVLRRDVYESAPLDPRFQGWGQEDESWALALRSLHGDPWRGDAPLWHWWHPPQERRSRHFGSAESKALGERYRCAAGDPQAMTRLIAEGRRHDHDRPPSRCNH